MAGVYPHAWDDRTRGARRPRGRDRARFSTASPLAGRGEVIELHPGLDLLVPAPHADVEPDGIGPRVLPVDLAGARILGAAGGFQRGACLVHVVHVETNVMDALHGGRATGEIRGVLTARDRKSVV